MLILRIRLTRWVGALHQVPMHITPNLRITLHIILVTVLHMGKETRTHSNRLRLDIFTSTIIRGIPALLLLLGAGVDLLLARAEGMLKECGRALGRERGEHERAVGIGVSG